MESSPPPTFQEIPIQVFSAHLDSKSYQPGHVKKVFLFTKSEQFPEICEEGSVVLYSEPIHFTHIFNIPISVPKEGKNAYLKFISHHKVYKCDYKTQDQSIWCYMDDFQLVEKEEECGCKPPSYPCEKFSIKKKV